MRVPVGPIRDLRLAVFINYRHDTSMRKSTKHAIAQRLLALGGLLLFLTPIWLTGLHSTPSYVLVFGFILLTFSIISSMGFGPWGRYYSSLYLAEHEAALKSLKAKQPWQ